MKDILSYTDLTSKEGMTLQRGMNYRPSGKSYSIFLMSVRENSPYNDDFDKDNNLIYEGHDLPRRQGVDSKKLDQPMFSLNGNLTENGKFYKAAEDYKLGRRNREKVQVYEKVNNGIWSDKGVYYLVDARTEYSDLEKRKVFKFVLSPIEVQSNIEEVVEDFEFSRRIPTIVKQKVWQRDNGQCVQCGSRDDLHFDHIIPFSKGGSSLTEDNVQILCRKCNLSKSAKIK